eukprot:Sspe_Gene.73488::Locus_44423_Transcript_1_3_Confidence_0.375_Length_444::g.73488::m.73488
MYWVYAGKEWGDDAFTWKEKTDSRSGKVYYVNKATHAKVWSLPPSGTTAGTDRSKQHTKRSRPPLCTVGDDLMQYSGGKAPELVCLGIGFSCSTVVARH